MILRHKGELVAESAAPKFAIYSKMVAYAKRSGFMLRSDAAGRLALRMLEQRG
jgi:hypothetical protein